MQQEIVFSLAYLLYRMPLILDPNGGKKNYDSEVLINIDPVYVLLQHSSIALLIPMECSDHMILDLFHRIPCLINFVISKKVFKNAHLWDTSLHIYQSSKQQGNIYWNNNIIIGLYGVGL